MITRSELERRFKYHPPTDPKQGQKHELVNELCFELALKLCQLTKEGREQSLMITELELVRTWANASIARPQGG